MVGLSRSKIHGEDRAPVILMAYAFAVPLLVIPLPIGQSMGAVDLLLPLGLFVWLRQRWAQNRVVGVLFWVTLAAAFFSAVVNIFVGGSESSAIAIDAALIARMIGIFIPSLIILSTTALAQRQLVLILKAILASAALSCVVGILLHLAGVQVRPEQQKIWDLDGSTLRAGGLLGNSGDMGHIAVILGMLVLSAGVVYSLSHPFVLVMLAAVAFYVIYISSSRAALLSIFVCVAFMVPVYLAGKRIIAFALGIPPLALGLITLWSGADLPNEFGATLRRFDVFNFSGQSEFLSSNARLNSWNIMLDQVQSKPWVGIGYGRAESLTGAGDNSFLTVLVETGLVGGLAYSGLWLSLVWIALRLKASPGRNAALALVLGEVAFMLTVDTHRMWPSTPVVLMAIAAVIRLSQENSREQSSIAKSAQLVK